MSSKVKIVVAEDHPLFLTALKNVLNEIPFVDVVASYSNPEFVVPYIKNHQVDILVTDLDMPNLNGLELSKKALEVDENLKILVVSMLNKSDLSKELKKIGINGYLLKNADRQEYEKALKKIINNETYFSNEVEREIRMSNEELIRLTKRETEVLQLIAEENTIQEIAEILFVAPTTVISHRKKLLSKFGAKNTAGLIKRAMEKKLIK
jgi:DNA-binding NarL/FixJ family response regulator